LNFKADYLSKNNDMQTIFRVLLAVVIKYTLILLCVFGIFQPASALQVQHLNTQTATATGAGASGTPSIASFNIPAGKDRVLFIWPTFERDHCSPADVAAGFCSGANTLGTGLGDNYPEPRTGRPPATTSNNQLTARVVGAGGTINKQNALVIGGTPSGDTRFLNISNSPTGSPAGTATFSISSFHIVLFESEINTLLGGAASGTVSITLPDTVAPTNAGDDAMLIASVFQNVEQTVNGFVRNATATAQAVAGVDPAGNFTMTVAAYDAGQVPLSPNDGKLVMATNSSTEGFVAPTGYTALATFSTNNAAGAFDTPLGGLTNEPNGVSGGAYFTNGGATPGSTYSITAAGAVATKVYGGTTASFLLKASTTVTVNKTTLVAAGGPFTFTATNTTGTFSSVSTTAVSTPVSAGTVSLATPSTATTITEPAVAGFALTSIVCTGLGAGGTATPTINAAGAGGSVLLNTAATLGGSDIVCTFTNTKRPTITVTKAASQANFVIGQTGQFYTITINVTDGPTSAPINLTDSLPAGVTLSGAPSIGGSAIASCPTTGSNLTGCSIANPATSPIVITVPVNVAVTASTATNSATVSGGGDLACTGVASACTGTTPNTPVLAQASVTITKTDNKSLATSGGTNSYVLSLSNQGPSPANGVIVTDAVGAGLTCPPTSQVTCTVTGVGAVCPAAPLTIASLTGGLAIATLPASGALQFAYTCSVN
jgi:uncharacterized repeat protein (TIGR01451 family)